MTKDFTKYNKKPRISIKGILGKLLKPAVDYRDNIIDLATVQQAKKNYRVNEEIVQIDGVKYLKRQYQSHYAGLLPPQYTEIKE